MFTGIVREIGLTASIAANRDGVRLEIEAPETAVSAAVGDSIAIDGCCLTVTGVADGRVSFEAVPEVRPDVAGNLVAGVQVNVEPALRAGEPRETVPSRLTMRPAISGIDAGPRRPEPRHRVDHHVGNRRDSHSAVVRSRSVNPPGRYSTATAIDA